MMAASTSQLCLVCVLLCNVLCCVGVEKRRKPLRAPTQSSARSNKVVKTATASDSASDTASASAVFMSNWLSGKPADALAVSNATMPLTAGTPTPPTASNAAAASAASGSGDDDMEYVLLMLDPMTSMYALRNALTARKGWERFVKRGLHTLKKPEYEVRLCCLMWYTVVEGCV